MNALALDLIRADERCQPRATFDTELVNQYAEAMAAGDTFPPVKTFFDGADHFLADGFHRYHAAKSLGLVEIDADVSEGTLRDAILYSCSANAAHGWRRTNDDKRRAVLRLLNDPEWQRWSDREIARKCNVGADMVGRLRPAPSVAERQIERTVQRGGTIYTQKTANIGARPASRPVDDAPVFDATPTGQTWRDHASPKAQADIDAVNREDWATKVQDVVRIVQSLPDAITAGGRFPALLLHSINPADLEAAAKWLTAFSIEIRNRKDPAHVAA